MLLYILAALGPRFLGSRRRHSSVSLDNLPCSNNTSSRPSPLREHQNETDMNEDFSRNAVVNCNTGNSSDGNKSKLMFGNVSSIPIVLCGMLQSDVFGPNFNMARPSPTIVEESSTGDSNHCDNQQQERRPTRRAYFDPQQFGDDTDNNNDSSAGQFDEGSA